MLWIRSLYTHQAILSLRKQPLVLSLGLFFLVVFFLTLPYQIGRFASSGERLLNQVPGFEQDFKALLEGTNCRIDTTLQCDVQNQVYQLDTYQVALLYDAYESLERQNLLVLNADYMTITNDQGLVIVVGNYSNLGQVTFQQLNQQIDSGETSLTHLSQDVLRLIDLSQFFERFYLQYALVFLQNLIYILAIAFFLGFIQKRSQLPLSFQERVTMVILLMISPALLAVLVSFYVPEAALIFFSVMLMLRLYLIYQGLLHQKFEL